MKLIKPVETKTGYNIYLKYKKKVLVHRFFNKRISVDNMIKIAIMFEEYMLKERKNKRMMFYKEER